MKKDSTHILVTITLAFVTLVIGIQLGRNMNNGDVTIRMSAESATRPSDAIETAADSSDTQTATQSVLGKKMNINTATAEELDALPGIGPVLAQRIIDYRQENGAFSDASELARVTGIGEKKLNEIIELITVEDE